MPAPPAVAPAPHRPRFVSRRFAARRLWSLRLPLLLLTAAALAALPAGCGDRGPQVIVYAALDREFSEPILKDFERETGIRVQPKFDTESTKTVGLTNLIIAERNRPRCDVFWNNEILNTLRLERQGLLDLYPSVHAKDFPAAFRDAEGAWHGFAARARVLIVNTDLVPEDRRPTSILDLTDPAWKGKCCIAKPLFGMTATHAAVLFAHWGDDEAKAYFRKVRENAVMLASNKQTALAVAGGEMAFGMTDTDDAIIEIERGMPVAIVYPDQGEGAMGTLFIPNTLAIVRGGPNPEAARRLVDYLLTPEVESRLAEGRSAQIPLSARTQARVRVETPHTIRAMEVDFDAAADKWDTAAAFLRDLFAAAD